MSDKYFTLDTNILIYALDRQAGARHVLASQIIDLATVSTNCWLTLQSVSEFYAAATRKRLVPVAGARDQALDWLSMFRIAAASASGVRTALGIAASGRASYWDALLAITAAEAGCTAILTEDLASDSMFAGVRVINPFAGTLLSAAAEALLTLD